METTMAIPLCNQSNISDTTSEDCSDTPVVAGATILSPVIMFIIGVVGNVVAICTIQISRNTTRTSKFYILISGLAWTDLMGIVLTTPSVISAYINGRRWVGGEAHCFYQGFAMTCAGLCTTLIICAISVERFLALRCVFFYSSRCSHGSTRCLIGGLWACVIWFGLLPLVGFGRYEVQYPGTWCFLDFHSDDGLVNAYAYIYASVNLALVLTMIMCNGHVVYTLYTLRKRKEFLVEEASKRDSLLTSQNTDWSTGGFRAVRKKHSAVDTQMIVLMCAITTTFVICWAPLMLQIIVTISTKKPNYLWDLAAIRLASLNQLLDPWLYILLRRSLFLKIQANAAKLWRTVCFCKRRHNTEQDETVRILGVEMKRESFIDANVNDNHAGNLKLNQINCEIDRRIPDVSNVHPNNSYSVSSPLPDVTNTGLCSINMGNDFVKKDGGDKLPIDQKSVPSDNNADVRGLATNENRQQQEYVCRFEFGKSNEERSSDVGSVCIKVLFLGDKCLEKNGRSRTCPRLQVMNSEPSPSDVTSSGALIINDNRVTTLELSACHLAPRSLSPCQHHMDLSAPVSSYDMNDVSVGSGNRTSLRRTKSDI